MTNYEIVNEVLNGKTYREIGAMLGISRQAVHARVKYMLSSKISKIAYRGIYDYFVDTEHMNYRTFAAEVNKYEQVINVQTLTKFICGQSQNITIKAIIRICEVVGKPFEEVFARREQVKGGSHNA